MRFLVQPQTPNIFFLSRICIENKMPIIFFPKKNSALFLPVCNAERLRSTSAVSNTGQLQLDTATFLEMRTIFTEIISSQFLNTIFSGGWIIFFRRYSPRRKMFFFVFFLSLHANRFTGRPEKEEKIRFFFLFFFLNSVRRCCNILRDLLQLLLLQLR